MKTIPLPLIEIGDALANAPEGARTLSLHARYYGTLAEYFAYGEGPVSLTHMDGICVLPDGNGGATFVLDPEEKDGHFLAVAFHVRGPDVMILTRLVHPVFHLSLSETDGEDGKCLESRATVRLGFGSHPRSEVVSLAARNMFRSWFPMIEAELSEMSDEEVASLDLGECGEVGP